MIGRPRQIAWPSNVSNKVSITPACVNCSYSHHRHASRQARSCSMSALRILKPPRPCLRPARDVARLVRTPPHRIQTPRKSSHGTTSSISASYLTHDPDVNKSSTRFRFRGALKPPRSPIPLSISAWVILPPSSTTGPSPRLASMLARAIARASGFALGMIPPIRYGLDAQRQMKNASPPHPVSALPIRILTSSKLPSRRPSTPVGRPQCAANRPP